ncbi:hypothetical protein ALQ64_03120 [Pseudomonas cannabina]|uniref:Uncharacterized protein n=1 Tax=Pseudomonas cannabina TaxID=86840 RepID=A0A3M3K208_PSECA|nr:hypothetical protein [Pseudomonas cannabina]RMN17142.1 hypothetical protein ALQ64_03120 [Pseudomonas cannabina]
MSKVNLNTILLYRGDAEHRPVDKELPLSGVEKLFMGIQFPSKGITFLYGHKCPAIPYFRDYAGTIGLDAAMVDIHVEVGQWFRHKIDLSDSPDRGLCNARFLNIARARREVTDIMEKVWIQELGPERAAEEDWPRLPTAYPAFFDSVHDLPEFRHLDVIAYTIQTVEVGPIQVATVFNLDAIETFDAGFKFEGTDLVL